MGSISGFFNNIRLIIAPELNFRFSHSSLQDYHRIRFKILEKIVEGLSKYVSQGL